MVEDRGGILVVNCGSSSLQVDVVDAGDREHPVLRLEEPFTDAAASPLAQAVADEEGPLAAVAHRFVHGGDARGPNRIDDAELRRLGSIDWLAPLHLPPAIAATRTLLDARPDLPAFACFDTAFHAGLPPASRVLPIPERWRRQHGFQRYGFHGPGHQWAAERTAALLGRPLDELRLVTAHLGGGASATAVDRGRSIDTTMGLTPLAGMAMTTRSGSIDPGVLLRLVSLGEPIDQLTTEVNRDAGVAGISGGTGDLRRLYPQADGGDEAAATAVAVYVRGIAQGIAAMATSLGRLDAVAFTGGAGSGSARLRSEVCARLGVLGVALDEQANADADVRDHDALVASAGSPVPVAVVKAREATVLARSVRAVLG